MRHIADELGAIQPCSAADLAALATVLVGSIERAQRFARGVEVLSAPYADNPRSIFWRTDERSWMVLAGNLDVLALIWAASAPERPAPESRAQGARPTPVPA